MTTRIGRTTVLCRDLPAVAAFYRDAFGYRTLFEGDLDGYPLLHVGPGEVADGGLWLRPADPDDPVGRQGGSGPFLVLYLDSPGELDETLDRCTRLGAAAHVAPFTEGATGDRYAHVRDLEGNEIVLVAPAPRDDRA